MQYLSNTGRLGLRLLGVGLIVSMVVLNCEYHALYLGAFGIAAYGWSPVAQILVSIAVNLGLWGGAVLLARVVAEAMVRIPVRTDD